MTFQRSKNKTVNKVCTTLSYIVSHKKCKSADNSKFTNLNSTSPYKPSYPKTDKPTLIYIDIDSFKKDPNPPPPTLGYLSPAPRFFLPINFIAPPPPFPRPPKATRWAGIWQDKKWLPPIKKSVANVRFSRAPAEISTFPGPDAVLAPVRRPSQPGGFGEGNDRAPLNRGKWVIRGLFYRGAGNEVHRDRMGSFDVGV